MISERDAARQDTTLERPPLMQLDGSQAKLIFAAGSAWLERNAALVNSLNVFPVPDGDTGTNMVLTMQSALREAHNTPSHNVGDVFQALAHGALLGARGNSGVILSQIIRGCAHSIDRRDAIDAAQLAEALAEGSRTAYKGVVKPVEGTILTVIREAAAAAQRAPERDSINAVLTRAVEAARSALARTPDLLPVLREAGVVDAGGQGLLFILEGALYYLDGSQAPIASIGEGAEHLEAFARAEGWGYDIQFHIRGINLDVEEIRRRISEMGESALIVGDSSLVKVHVHAPNPGEIIKYGAEQGALVNVIIENMQQQYVEFVAGTKSGQAPAISGAPPQPPHEESSEEIATITVVPGPGFRQIFESLGVSAVVAGGPTMNPSTQDLINAVESVSAKHILLLPNDKNIIPAAEQAKKLSDKQIEIVYSRTIPQGIAALLAFNYQNDLESNARMMNRALERVRTIEITRATRTVQLDSLGVRKGAPIALVDGNLVATGKDVQDLLIETLHRVRAEESEVITVYYGSDVSPDTAKELLMRIKGEFPNQEVEMHSGGQPLYPFIVSVD